MKKDIIIHEVLSHCKVDIDAVRSKLRYTHYVAARHMICYFLRKFTEMSFHEIGKLINRDHASVLHGCNAINNRMDFDRKYREQLLDLTLKINNEINDNEYSFGNVFEFQLNDFYV